MPTSVEKPVPLDAYENHGDAQRDVPFSLRCAERLYCPGVAHVRGTDVRGAKFTEATVFENVSARGLYIHLQHSVPAGSRLLVIFTFSPLASPDMPVPKVAVRGEVRRIERSSQGNVLGVGIHFNHHRFL
jgi:hypothetical protein